MEDENDFFQKKEEYFEFKKYYDLLVKERKRYSITTVMVMIFGFFAIFAAIISELYLLLIIDLVSMYIVYKSYMKTEYKFKILKRLNDFGKNLYEDTVE